MAPALLRTSVGRSPHRLLRNTLLAGVSEASEVLLFLLVFLAARLLGPESFGQYGTAMAFVGLFRVLGELGMPAASTVAASRDPLVAGRTFGNLLGLQVVLCGVAVAACLATGRLLFDGVTWLAVVVLCGELAARAVLTTARWILRVFGCFASEALAMSVERLSILLLGITALLAGGGVLGLAGVYAAVRAANALGLLAWVRARVLPLRLRNDRQAWRSLLREGLPLALSGACLALVVQIDSVLLDRLGSARQVGLYRAPLRITEGVMLLPRAVAAALLPALPALYARDARGLDAPYRHAARLLLVAGLVVAVPGLALPGPLVRLVFGAAYDEAAEPARLLWLAVIPAFLAVLGEVVLASAGRTRAILPLTAVALGLDTLLCLVWIPAYGLMGAAAATLVAVGAHAVLVAIAAARTGLRAGWPSLLGAAFVSGSLATLAAWKVSSRSPVAAFATGVVVLLSASLGLALIEREERARLRAFWRTIRR